MTFEIAQNPWSCPIDQKVNECFLESVTEPNGFKLDMDGPEGSLNPLLRVQIMSDGLEVQILNFEVKEKWKRDQILVLKWSEKT